nr:unnamed protein product [Digitaria exilis]
MPPQVHNPRTRRGHMTKKVVPSAPLPPAGPRASGAGGPPAMVTVRCDPFQVRVIRLFRPAPNPSSASHTRALLLDRNRCPYHTQLSVPPVVPAVPRMRSAHDLPRKLRVAENCHGAPVQSKPKQRKERRLSLAIHAPPLPFWLPTCGAFEPPTLTLWPQEFGVGSEPSVVYLCLVDRITDRRVHRSRADGPPAHDERPASSQRCCPLRRCCQSIRADRAPDQNGRIARPGPRAKAKAKRPALVSEAPCLSYTRRSSKARQRTPSTLNPLDYNKAVRSLFRAKARLTFLSLLPLFSQQQQRPNLIS